MPLAKFAVGVKTAVRVRPVPLMAPSVPPVTAMSPAEPSHANVLPGFSENVNVMSVVSPDLSLDKSDVIVIVGANVSKLIVGELLADPGLPIAS